ncbi:MAG: SDR family oxidoreductase [Deltaproteobacteria bacterium]|nr:SDR family oxidoreductase [Deltaproteobacteria bacterium]
MDLGLKNKVALVTGAGSQVGLGKAIALTLAKEGCDIIVSDMDISGAEKTAAEIREIGRRSLAVKTDITKIDEVNAMVKAGLDEFKKIDILINNAGGTRFAGFLSEANLEDIEHEIRLNLLGTLYCSKAVIPHMLENKSGKIVNIASTAAKMGVPGGCGYSSAKTGILGLTRSLAMEAGRMGINVNAVAPGFVLTNFYGGEGAPMLEILPPEMKNPEKLTALGKKILPQDIANTVLFLVTELSDKITGQLIIVDCGQIMS